MLPVCVIPKHVISNLDNRTRQDAPVVKVELLKTIVSEYTFIELGLNTFCLKCQQTKLQTRGSKLVYTLSDKVCLSNRSYIKTIMKFGFVCVKSKLKVSISSFDVNEPTMLTRREFLLDSAMGKK